MEVTAGLDSGPVCALKDEAIGPEDTYGTLAERLSGLGGELLVAALSDRPRCVAQDDSRATYAEKIGPEDRRLDPSRTAAELERAVRALHPHIGAQALLADGTVLGVTRARALAEGPPAGAWSLDGPRPVLGCAEGALELLDVKPPGRNEMGAEDWLRGLRR
jgi:methionyl-tRNA formyltransferase